MRDLLRWWLLGLLVRLPHAFDRFGVSRMRQMLIGRCMRPYYLP